jgi:polar amino acid transport system substrate-binding protein
MKNRVRRILWSCVGTILALQAPRAGAMDMIGNCEVTGQKGQYSFNPMIPGQLTVRANLPSPGWWNGDTPDAVKDGFEYCMAANMAYRLGVDNVAVVYAAWTQVIAGSARNFDLTLSQASITEPRKKRRSIFPSPISAPTSACS